MKLIFLNLILVSNQEKLMNGETSEDELLYSNTVIYDTKEKLTMEEMAEKFAKGIEELFLSMEKDRDKIDEARDMINSWIRIFREEEFTKARKSTADHAFGITYDNKRENKFDEAKESFLEVAHHSRKSGSNLFINCIEPYLKK